MNINTWHRLATVYAFAEMLNHHYVCEEDQFITAEHFSRCIDEQLYTVISNWDTLFVSLLTAGLGLFILSRGR